MLQKHVISVMKQHTFEAMLGFFAGQNKKRAGFHENRPFHSQFMLCLCITFRDRHVPDNQAKGDFVQHIGEVINDVQSA